MNDKITWDKSTADALASLLGRLRPDWQMPGIMAALADERLRGRNPFAVARAAILAAGNPKVRTPAVIAMDGEHWNEPDAPKPTWMPPPFETQRIPPRTEAEVESAALAAAAAKATLAATKATLRCACGQSIPRSEWAGHTCEATA